MGAVKPSRGSAVKPSAAVDGPSRRTSQGELVEQLLHQHQRALSIPELLEAARTQQPRIGRATVYRHLKRLVDDGRAITVELPGEPPRYEAAGRHHHHHFRCSECDRVYDLPGCPSGLKNFVPPGFTLTGHHVVLEGVCANCA